MQSVTQDLLWVLTLDLISVSSVSSRLGEFHSVTLSFLTLSILEITTKNFVECSLICVCVDLIQGLCFGKHNTEMVLCIH